MAQATDFTLSNQAFGTFRTELNSILSAVNSCQSGTTTPPSAVAGTIWLDTTSATTPTLKYYDGTDNISLATIDHTANTVNWLDSTVSVTGLTTTATGTVLTLSDSANTSTVNLIIDNQKEIRFRETTANGTNYVALKAPASLSADLTFTLPTADGTNGQVLTTNGSGTLSFTTLSTALNTPLAITGNATAGSEIRLPEDTDNGSNYVALKAPDTLASNLTLTLPSADGTANQVLKTDGSGVLSFTTISSTPEQLVKSMPLASGGSLTAGRGVFINSSGEVALYPTLNTVGTEYSNSNATAYTAFSKNGTRALKFTTAGYVYTFTGVVLSGTANAVNGGTTVSATMSSYAGGDDIIAPCYINAISDTEFYVVAGRYVNPAGLGGYNYESKHFVVTVDASGNCTKGSEVTLSGSGGGGRGNYFYVGKITDSVYAFWGYSDDGASNQYRTVTIAGTTVTLTTDTEAGSFAQFANGFNIVYTTNNIIGYGLSTNWRTASYTAGNIGTVTTTATITDANTTPAWFRITDARVLVYYQDTSLLYKLRTYDVNQTTGALTLVDTEFLTGTAWASSAGNFRFISSTSGVFKYLVSGFYYVNSIALDSSGNITGFNLGSKIDTGDITPVYNTSNDFFINYTQATPRLKTYTVNASSTTTPNYLGVAKETDSTTPVNIVTDGVASGLSGLTAGTLYYISTNYDGTVSTDSTSGILVGKAISATEILLQRSNVQ
jgi:hypothetical protein